MAHNILHDPSSGFEDLSGYYENDHIEDVRKMWHSGADQDYIVLVTKSSALIKIKTRCIVGHKSK